VLLDRMMADAKLPVTEQRRLRALAAGDASAAQPSRRVPRGSLPMLPYEDPLRGRAINPRIVGGQQRKSHADIVAETNGYERDMFRGRPNGGLARDEQKSALQDRYLNSTVGAPRRSQPKQPAPQPRQESEASALHAQVRAEIAERQEFLTSMRAMGRAAEHEDTIQQQVAERMTELRKLERMMRDG